LRTEWQRGMAERNADVPQTNRIEFRMGVNVGDIVVEDDDLFGGGVNVAARWKIWPRQEVFVFRPVSRKMHPASWIWNLRKWVSSYLKKIARPVQVYRIPIAPTPQERHLYRSQISLLWLCCHSRI
jgi:adenylate cyclase